MALTQEEQKLLELWECLLWPEIATKTLSAVVEFINNTIKKGRKNGECWLHKLHNCLGIPEDEPFKNYGGCGLKIVNFLIKELEKKYASCSVTINKFEEGEFWTLHFDASGLLPDLTEENELP
jgi:hypothetical protein